MSLGQELTLSPSRVTDRIPSSFTGRQRLWVRYVVQFSYFNSCPFSNNPNRATPHILEVSSS